MPSFRESRSENTKLEFPSSDVFDDDYLYFYGPRLDEACTRADADRVCSLGPVAAGDRVLDLACGHGRIANALAERGGSVTGLDLMPSFLEIARTDAARRGVSVEYVEGSMTEIPWSERFDVVISWFTAFGYFDDLRNRQVLESVRRSLLPAGRLLLELNHGPVLLAGFLPAVVTRRGADRMIDEHRYDPSTGRIHTERTILRDGRQRSFEYSTRIFGFPELRDWLVQAGFREVEGFGPDCKPLTPEARRMIVRATR